MLPILLVVLVLHFCFAHFATGLMLKFVGAMVIITIGEILFLSGVDGSVMKMGDYVGSSVQKISRFSVVLFFAFIFGLCATIAEPDVSVLSDQVMREGLMSVPKFVFIFIVGAGVGAFVAFALFRIVKRINYKLVITALMVVILIISCFAKGSLLAVAFDAGGATTGIVTSPFLLALTAGVAKNRNSSTSEDNFGTIGIASLGPVLAVLLLSLLTMGQGEGAVASSAAQLNIFLNTLIDASLAIIPLVLVFFIFDICFLKIAKRKKISLIIGCAITFIGLYMFLFGINFGIIEMGTAVGNFLASSSKFAAIAVALVIGFLITFTEPAVRVLGAQVEDITQGNIRRKFVTIAIAIAMMAAVCLAVLKILFDIPMLWIILIGYGLVLVLLPFSSGTFVSIAFDSGGVASGPMCAAFVLPLMTGFAASNGGAAEGFGLIAIVAMMPILMIEMLGIVYKFKLGASSARAYRKALRISYGIDMYSNIDSLEQAYNRRRQLKQYEKDVIAAVDDKNLLEKQLDEIRKIKGEDNGIKG